MDKYIIRKIKKKVKDKYTYNYFNDNNKKLSKSSASKYLNKLYIPPAYDNVYINKDKTAKVLAIGTDSKNRKQYIYNKSFIKGQTNNKFRKLIEFGENYNYIVNKIDRDLLLIDESKDKQIAMILKIIIECNFRIGNNKYVEQNNSYGVSTLQKKHFKVKKNEVFIDFIGKKGVRNKCSLKNKKLIKNIKSKRKSIRKNDNIFSYRNKNEYVNITSNDVNDYLRDIGDYTTKNFRTWGANIELIKELLDKDSLKDSILMVSTKLHHTPSICKKNYLEPNLIAFYNDDPIEFKKYFNKDINTKFTKFLKEYY